MCFYKVDTRSKLVCGLLHSSDSNCELMDPNILLILLHFECYSNLGLYRTGSSSILPLLQYLQSSVGLLYTIGDVRSHIKGANRGVAEVLFFCSEKL